MTNSSLFEAFQQNKNPLLAPKMAAYMKNKFPFLGIVSPKRKELQKAFLKEKLKVKIIDWGFVIDCFEMPEREYQYLAIDYLISLKKYVQSTDIEILEQLITSKSWWDSVDGLDQIVGALVLKNPQLIDSHIRKWMLSENIWLNRVSINYQLEYKDKTDPKLLSEAILANIGTKEFFVNKAIGWSLREYSKTNRNWVENFIAIHKESLSNLSIREGNKYL